MSTIDKIQVQLPFSDLTDEERLYLQKLLRIFLDRGDPTKRTDGARLKVSPQGEIVLKDQNSPGGFPWVHGSMTNDPLPCVYPEEVYRAVKQMVEVLLSEAALPELKSVITELHFEKHDVAQDFEEAVSDNEAFQFIHNHLQDFKDPSFIGAFFGNVKTHNNQKMRSAKSRIMTQRYEAWFSQNIQQLREFENQLQEIATELRSALKTHMSSNSLTPVNTILVPYSWSESLAFQYHGHEVGLRFADWDKAFTYPFTVTLVQSFAPGYSQRACLLTSSGPFDLKGIFDGLGVTFEKKYMTIVNLTRNKELCIRANIVRLLTFLMQKEQLENDISE